MEGRKERIQPLLVHVAELYVDQFEWVFRFAVAGDAHELERGDEEVLKTEEIEAIRQNHSDLLETWWAAPA